MRYRHDVAYGLWSVPYSLPFTLAPCKRLNMSITCTGCCLKGFQVGPVVTELRHILPDVDTKPPQEEKYYAPLSLMLSQPGVPSQRVSEVNAQVGHPASTRVNSPRIERAWNVSSSVAVVPRVISSKRLVSSRATTRRRSVPRCVTSSCSKRSSR